MALEMLLLGWWVYLQEQWGIPSCSHSWSTVHSLREVNSLRKSRCSLNEASWMSSYVLGQCTPEYMLQYTGTILSLIVASGVGTKSFHCSLSCFLWKTCPSSAWWAGWGVRKEEQGRGCQSPVLKLIIFSREKHLLPPPWMIKQKQMQLLGGSGHVEWGVSWF